MADAAPIWGCRVQTPVGSFALGGGFVAVRQTFVLGGQDTRLRAKAAAGTGLKRELSANRLSRRMDCRKPGAASRRPDMAQSFDYGPARPASLVIAIAHWSSRGAVEFRVVQEWQRPWPRRSNVWRKGTSLRGGVRRLRGMTTILRKYHSVARCTLLGEMVEDTAHRYYYRPHVGGELTFVDKESPAIHLSPCPACPDWPAGQQRGSAVGTNSR
jgi:hypothetical protein